MPDENCNSKSYFVCHQPRGYPRPHLLRLPSVEMTMGGVAYHLIMLINHRSSICSGGAISARTCGVCHREQNNIKCY